MMESVNPTIRAVPARGGPKSAETVLTARRLAQAYFESGMRDYWLLYNVWAEDNAGTRYPSFDEFLGPGVTAATHLAFALEVFLKVLSAQRSGHYPHGHRLSRIVVDLPYAVRQSLSRRLVERRAIDATKYLTEFSVQLGVTDQPRQFQYRLSCVDSDPPDWTRPDAFDAEIGACDDAYRQWRYIYERGMSAEKVSARFFGLIHLNQAIATEIDGYAEGVLIAGRSD